MGELYCPNEELVSGTSPILSVSSNGLLDGHALWPLLVLLACVPKLSLRSLVSILILM